MTLQEFINKYNGQYVDFDGYYGPQCVDLAQFWSKNLGGPQFTGDAADIYGQGSPFYTSIPNTPDAVPVPGDIVIWGGALNGGPGHIAVFVSGNSSSFSSFDQNWPLNSPCHIQYHNYNYVVGWLHPKSGGGQVSNPIDVLRIVAGEIEGYGLPDVYNGKYDGELQAAWGDKPIEEFIRHGFQQASNGSSLKYQLEAKITELEQTGQYEKVDETLYRKK